MSGKMEVLKMGEGDEHHQNIEKSSEKELIREGGSLDYWNDYKMDNDGVQDAWKVREQLMLHHLSGVKDPVARSD